MKKFILASIVAVGILGGCGSEEVDTVKEEPQQEETVVKEQPKKEEPKKEEPKKPTLEAEAVTLSVVYTEDIFPTMLELSSVLQVVTNLVVDSTGYAGSVGFSKDMAFLLELSYEVDALLSQVEPVNPELVKVNDLLKQSNVTLREGMLLYEEGVYNSDVDKINQATEKFLAAGDLMQDATLILEGIENNM